MKCFQIVYFKSLFIVHCIHASISIWNVYLIIVVMKWASKIEMVVKQTTKLPMNGLKVFLSGILVVWMRFHSKFDEIDWISIGFEYFIILSSLFFCFTLWMRWTRGTIAFDLIDQNSFQIPLSRSLNNPKKQCDLNLMAKKMMVLVECSLDGLYCISEFRKTACEIENVCYRDCVSFVSAS